MAADGGGARAGRRLERVGRGLIVAGVVAVVLALLGAGLLLTTAAVGEEAGPDETPPSSRADRARARPGSRPDATSSVPLRESAPADLLVGTAVDARALRNDRDYARRIAAEYGSVTPENSMKWAFVHPERHEYDFRAADEIVRFARRHDMAVRGHTLVWYREAPDWVTQHSWTRAELEQVLRNHIHTVVKRYRGKVAEWDVVNEALDEDGKLRDSVWTRVIGPDYIALAFEWAHEADPDAKLFYNDFDLEHSPAKAAATVALVGDLKAKGVPIDGVGLQGHELTVRTPTRPELDATLRSFTDLGLDVAITELDVGIHLPASDRELDHQATVYRDVLDACLDAPRCTSFTMWGTSDRHSWVPDEIDGFGDALPFDRDYRPKPAADALRTRLAEGR